MDIANAFRRNLVLLAALTAILCLCPGRGLAAAVRGWGSSAIDSREPRRKDFIAVSAGGYHSLALQRVCQYVLPGDLNDDCEVDFEDFAQMAANWLTDCNTEPPNPACVPK